MFNTSNIIKLDLIKRISGVYYLLKDGDVVYVGSSIDIHQRVKQHLMDGRKQFDSYTTYQVPVDSMEQYEYDEIIKLQPIYNKAHTLGETHSNRMPYDIGSTVYYADKKNGAVYCCSVIGYIIRRDTHIILKNKTTKDEIQVKKRGVYKTLHEAMNFSF